MRIGVGTPRGRYIRVGCPQPVISALTSEPWLTNRPDGKQTERIVTDWSFDESADDACV